MKTTRPTCRSWRGSQKASGLRSTPGCEPPPIVQDRREKQGRSGKVPGSNSTPVARSPAAAMTRRLHGRSSLQGFAACTASTPGHSWPCRNLTLHKLRVLLDDPGIDLRRLLGDRDAGDRGRGQPGGAAADCRAGGDQRHHPQQKPPSDENPSQTAEHGKLIFKYGVTYSDFDRISRAFPRSKGRRRCANSPRRSAISNRRSKGGSSGSIPIFSS